MMKMTDQEHLSAANKLICDKDDQIETLEMQLEYERANAETYRGIMLRQDDEIRRLRGEFSRAEAALAKYRRDWARSKRD